MVDYCLLLMIPWNTVPPADRLFRQFIVYDGDDVNLNMHISSIYLILC